MLFFCPASPPPPVQIAFPLPPLRTNSFPGERGSRKPEHQRLRAQSSLPAERRSPLRARSHSGGGYGFVERVPFGDSSGSAAAPCLPDAEALASWLRSSSGAGGVRRVHAVAVRSLDCLGTFVANNLISAYAKFDEVLDARKVFDEMPERSVVSWTAMMNAYLKLGHYGEVVRLFFDMVGSGLQGNSLTFVCLLKSCGERCDAKLGQQVHCCIVKGGWSNVIVDSAVAHFYAQCGNVASASAIFDKMASRDVISWTTMITAYVQHGHGDQALRMFSEMVSEGFRPNEFTVCSVLKACAEEKTVRFGKQLHCAVVKKMYKNDIHVGSALVTMYARCGEIFDAQTVFDMMPRRNTITWTSMISGYAQSGHGEKAILLFRKMKMRRVFVNNLTIVGLLSACGSLQSLYLGKELHAQIIKNSMQDNLQIGSTLVWFYCKCGVYSYAAIILEAMPDRDAISWTALISGYNNLGHNVEALKSLDDMLWDGVKPNTYTYSSALKACAKLEALQYGRKIHGFVNKTQDFSNVFVGSSLIDMYMRCGKVDEARRVFDAMPEHNLVTWKVIITGFAQNGLCEEALKYMYLMQREGHEVDDFVLSTVLTSCGDLQWKSISFSGSLAGSVSARN
ncbi:pentatricopeptide repeat-containing protein At4g18520, chloroplastic [Oryza brachyantha]|uniref:Pentacotripeptide-repeat region of PRORP domain-containing protein n=1 Tax=Oryza brachyantha TaxID=4533 RepID=J3N6P1_ORYBR|nr:pentatricopeptide repeat-containing protein At4g18520, chloroplastic [Oryza brachyantha]